jgi:hypothetical protein
MEVLFQIRRICDYRIDIFEVVDVICVFRGKPATDSDGKRPLIPIESGHRFRGKPATP